LTSFFVLIVVGMAAVGVLVFRLINDSQAGKADARANGIATTALSLYTSESRQASYDARTVARDLARTPPSQLRARASALASKAGLERVTMTVGSKRAFDIGDKTAIAPGAAVVRASGRRPTETLAVSELTAAQYGRALAGPGVEVIVRSGASTLASTLPATARLSLPTARGTVKLGSASYRVVTQALQGFGQRRVSASVLSDLDTTGGSLASDLLAAAFIAGFLLLAFFFSLLASRALHGQLVRFLGAARRLGSGDFSSPIPTTGNDEFALLGQEFNKMSSQLEARLGSPSSKRSDLGYASRPGGSVRYSPPGSTGTRCWSSP
jgi:methyl-accepting chemotaxis protein